jgi:hypothetical protein
MGTAQLEIGIEPTTLQQLYTYFLCDHLRKKTLVEMLKRTEPVFTHTHTHYPSTSTPLP